MSQEDTNNMLAAVGWANRRLGLFSGGDYCIVVRPVGPDYDWIAELLWLDGTVVTSRVAPHFYGALALLVRAIQPEPGVIAFPEKKCYLP